MNAAQLDARFNTVFAAMSTEPAKPYGRETLMPNLVLAAAMQSSPAGKGFTLTVSTGSTVVRSKSFGPKPAAEIPWAMPTLIAYFQAQMDSIYDALPTATQAAFAAEYVSAKDFISRGKLDVAKAIISGTPVAKDLETTKAKLLSFL